MNMGVVAGKPKSEHSLNFLVRLAAATFFSTRFNSVAPRAPADTGRWKRDR